MIIDMKLMVYVIGILHEAEERYNSKNYQAVSFPSLTLAVHIVKTEGGADGTGDDESAPQAPKETLKEVIIEIPIKPTDSIMSLQKKLNVREK